jgi:hypothetical protein
MASVEIESQIIFLINWVAINLTFLYPFYNQYFSSILGQLLGIILGVDF